MTVSWMSVRKYFKDERENVHHVAASFKLKKRCKIANMVFHVLDKVSVTWKDKLLDFFADGASNMQGIDIGALT